MNGMFEPSALNYSLIFLASFILGLSKAGIKGIDMMNVTIMALVFGGKASTGIVLPLLCAADIMAVSYYHRHAQWHYFRRIMPWMMVGILVGVFVGKEMDEAVFKAIMAVIIILTVIIMLFFEFRKQASVPHNLAFVGTMGLTAGFTTMLGNLAGAFANIYFLAMRLSKNDFIGTAAWVFLVINLFKLPFQVVYWKNITAESLLIDLQLFPALLLGFFAGIKIVARIRDAAYRKIVIGLTLAGAIVILFR